MISGWTRDAGREGDRKKGRNEDEGVCGREKHDHGRGAYGRAEKRTYRPKKQIGPRKGPPHEVN
jgi:hypothetical protein